MRTSYAVWRMVAGIPLGHSDGTTSTQPLWSLKCRAFGFVSTVQLSTVKNPGVKTQTKGSKNADVLGARQMGLWLSKLVLTIHFFLNFQLMLTDRQWKAGHLPLSTSTCKPVNCSRKLNSTNLQIFTQVKVCSMLYCFQAAGGCLLKLLTMYTSVYLVSLLSSLTLDVLRDVLLSRLSHT